MANENHYISATRVLMATKVCRTVAYFESILTIKSFYALITSRGLARSRDKQKLLYIPTQSAYGYKLDRMITLFDEFLPIKSLSPFDHFERSRDKP